MFEILLALSQFIFNFQGQLLTAEKLTKTTTIITMKSDTSAVCFFVLKIY